MNFLEALIEEDEAAYGIVEGKPAAHRADRFFQAVFRQPTEMLASLDGFFRLFSIRNVEGDRQNEGNLPLVVEKGRLRGQHIMEPAVDRQRFLEEGDRLPGRHHAGVVLGRVAGELGAAGSAQDLGKGLAFEVLRFETVARGGEPIGEDVALIRVLDRDDQGRGIDGLWQERPRGVEILGAFRLFIEHAADQYDAGQHQQGNRQRDGFRRRVQHRRIVVLEGPPEGDRPAKAHEREGNRDRAPGEPMAGLAQKYQRKSGRAELGQDRQRENERSHP